MMKKVKAMKSRTLSVHSRRPYLVSSFPDNDIDPPVAISSSRVVSTLDDDATSCSSVAALFCVVSDKCLVMDSIFSVTLSCCVNRLALLLLLLLLVVVAVAARFLSSCLGPASVMENSSCLSAFSISNMVEMLALRNACVVLCSCWRWFSTDLDSSTSPSSLAKLSNRSIHLRIVVIFSRPASLRVSSSGIVPRNARMSWKGGKCLF